jgi:hypothetical protein
MRSWFARLFQGVPSADPAALQAFLAAQAAFVAQKTVVDYCRVKAGRSEQKLFADPDFLAALRHCRWQTFAAAAQDVTAMAEAWLRPHAPGGEAELARSLARIGTAVLDESDAPAEERASLDAARDGLPWLLAANQATPPVSADRMALRAEQPLLATLPVHADQRVGETVAIRGALRFHIVASQQAMERAFDAPALAARLREA